MPRNKAILGFVSHYYLSGVHVVPFHVPYLLNILLMNAVKAPSVEQFLINIVQFIEQLFILLLLLSLLLILIVGCSFSSAVRPG